MPERPLVLTGFMSSGKTTVVRALGEAWGCVAVDLDEVIALSEGRPAWQIIEEDGEERFRAIETRVLQEVLELGDARVIALGGGAWIRTENRALVNSYKGISIWLDAPFEVCWSRIATGSDRRPLATNREQASKLYNERRPYYSMARIHVPISPETTVAELVEAIGRNLKR